VNISFKRTRAKVINLQIDIMKSHISDPQLSFLLTGKGGITKFRKGLTVDSTAASEQNTSIYYPIC